MNNYFKKLITILAAFAMAASSLVAQAQDNISGLVLDDEGNPAIGVAVFYNGTSTATMTDANGRFSIRRIQGKSLTFSCFGMKEEIVKVSNQKDLTVKLTSDKLTLDDAVVIGYGSVSRRDLTGSVSSVKAEEIMKSGSNNTLGALQGRVAGLSITSQSGEPGAGFQIKVRGNNSINAGSTPLFVIDGMQMNISSGDIATTSSTGNSSYDPMSFLNPNDIESIEVLKDASATAIYGARGANGVVIITTKNGASGYDKTMVDFDSSFGISEVPKYIEMLGAQEYIDYRFYRGDYGFYSFGRDVNGDDIIKVSDDAPLDGSDYQLYDWQKIMYRKALSQNYNISLSSMMGGKTQIAASIGYLNQEGLIYGNSHNRYSGRLKVDHKINNKFKIGANVNFARTVSEGAVSSGGGSLGYSGMVQYIYLERPIAKWTEDEDEYTQGVFGLKSLINEETFRQTVYDRLSGNAYMNYTILKGLDLRLNAAGGTSASSLMEYYSSHSKWGRSRNGKATNKNVSTFNYNVSATLNYSKDFNKIHHFDAMIGGEMVYNYSSSLTVGSYNFTDESTGPYNIGKGGIIENPDQGISDSATMSTFMRANYNYKKRYYLTFNFRADGSSKFYAGNRVGYFPSASVAWRINEEPFIKNNAPWIDNLKLRLSAGASGNDRISTYAALATLTTNYYSAGGTEIMGMAPASPANPKLKWETTYQYDAGFDLSILKEKINLTADIYYKDTRDMLYQATLSAQSGYTTQWQNLGKVENKGIEFALNTHNIDTRKFSWSTAFTFDMSRNKVLDIGGIEYTMVNISNGQLSSDISRIMVGEPIGIGWGYIADGNYQLDDFIITRDGREFPAEAVNNKNFNSFNYKLRDGVVTINGKTVKPGDRKYRDLDGDNEITSEDRTKISDSNPKWTAGMANNFTLGNFDFSFFLESVYGRQILNEFKLRSESGESGGTQNNNLAVDAWRGRWTAENPSNTYSGLRNQTNTYCSSYYVEDGSFLRLKTVTLGYNFNNKILSKINLRSARLAFNIDNALLFTKYSGMDPDVSSSSSLFSGFDRMSYPKARTYTFSLKLGF